MMKEEKAIGIGIMILRVGIGVLFIIHGWPKITGGTEVWGRLGGSMALLGIGFAPVFWGLMAALAEFAGGILLVVGLLARPAAFFMMFTMYVATLVKVSGAQAEGILGIVKDAGYPLSLVIVFISLLFLGSGTFALGSEIRGLTDKWYR